MARCQNCIYAEIYTDKDWCKRLVCRKTSKKGRTITWTMHVVGENLFTFFADWCSKHKAPSWCPLAEQEEYNGDSF